MRKRVSRDSVAVLSGGLVISFFLLAVAAPWITPFDPDSVSPLDRFKGPAWPHLLGTDELGRDILTRVIFGARISLGISCASVAIAALVGVGLGFAGAASRKIVRVPVMRLADVLLSVPEILLALVLIALLGASIQSVVMAISITYTPRFIRITQSSVLVARTLGYAEAARASGAGSIRIAIRHIFPNIMPVLMVQVTLSLANAILVESSLSFLGLGVQPPTASWGAMISESQVYMEQSIYLVLWPGLVIMLTVLSFNFLGDALADALNPRLRSQ